MRFPAKDELYPYFTLDIGQKLHHLYVLEIRYLESEPVLLEAFLAEQT